MNEEEQDIELLQAVEFADNVWFGRSTYDSDDEWLDEMDGAMAELAKAMGFSPRTSPIHPWRDSR